MSTHLHFRFNSQTVNAMGCFASRNNRIKIEVSVAAATPTSRIRDIPLLHEQKCILREFWELIEPSKSVIGKKESRVDTGFFLKNIIPLLGLESFKMEK